MKKFTLLLALWLLATAAVFAQDWAKNLGGTGTTDGTFPGENTVVATATDNADNVFALVVYRGTLTLGATTYTAPGNKNAYNPRGIVLVKYGSTGNVLWSVPLSNADGKFLDAYKLAVDANGDAVIGGEYQPAYANAMAPELDFGGGKTVTKDYQIIIAKYNGADGSCTFVKPFDKTTVTAVEQNAPTRTLTVFGLDNATNIYLVTMQQGATINEGSTIRKLDPNGDVQWTVNNGVAVQINVGVVDGNGNMVVQAALGTSSVQPSQFDLATETYPYAYKGYNILASFDNSGALKWTKVFKNGGAIFSQALDVDAAGNIYFIHGGNISDASNSPYGLLSDTGSGDYPIVKLNANGDLQKVVYRSYKNFNGAERRIAVNKATGEVYLYGIYSTYNNQPLIHGDLLHTGANNIGYLAILRYNSNLEETGGSFGINAAILGISNPLIHSTASGKLIISANIGMSGATTVGNTSLTGTKNKDAFITLMPSPTFIQGTTTTWLGGTTDWNSASNWSNGLPDANKKAVIPTGLSKYPTTFPATPTMGIFEVAQGVTLTALPADLKVTGKFINNGSIALTNLNSGNYTFTGFGIDVDGTGTVSLTANGYGTFTWNTAYAIKQKLILNSNVLITLNSNMQANEIQLDGSTKIYTGTSYQVRILSSLPNALTGFNSTRYIYGGGSLYRATATNGTYDFPLGDFNYYQPTKISFTNNTTVSNIVAKYASTAPTPTTLPATCKVNEVAITGYLSGLGVWTFTPNVAMSAGSYDIEIAASAYTSTAADKIALIKRANSFSDWAGLGHWVLTVINTSSFPNTVTAKLTGLTSFSDFAFGVAASTIPATLPVNLTQFTAKAQNNSVLLNWQTSMELNSDKFVVEHSTDGQNFTAIGEVKAKGTTGLSSAYNYRDVLPQSGWNYYKLMQVDNDGKTTELGIRTVNFGIPTSDIKLFPNPATDYFSIAGNTSPVSKVILTDLSGKTVLEKVNPSAKVALPNLPYGIYVLKVNYANGTVSKHKLSIK